MHISRTAGRTTGWRLATALTGLAALGASLLGPAATAAAPDRVQQVKSGSLTWGFKESFRAYIEGPIADGGIEVTAPATRLGDGTFRWSTGSGKVNAAKDKASLNFKGEVYFYGHNNALETWIINPRLRIDGDVAVLVADIASREGPDVVEYDNVDFAVLDFTGKSLSPNGQNVVKANDIPATLTAEGADAFAGFYDAGEELDPVDFKVKVAP